ncbi:MAG: amidohydrolase [Saprospiraceae bacterium]|nr:amidohydrolase [Saprospiraceae bacterium]
MITKKIKALAEDIHQEVIGIRRHLHQHPELSYHEEETADYLGNLLRNKGFSFEPNIGGHGIVLTIEGKQKGKGVVALRGDIDALPIQEENQVSYRSTRPGIMHACGHDVHTSSLLGSTLILNSLRDHFAGTVRIIFQPAEERLPGGASLMIKDGVLTNPTPSAIFGQHVHPPLEVGKVGVKSGMYMASADELFLTVTGKGGHAALPHDGIDPIVLTANIIQSLQQVVSRHGDPTTPTVVTFGKIASVGGATNVIPSEVKLEGTFRTMDEVWREKAHALMQHMVGQVALAHGGNAELRIDKGYPYLLNNEDLTGRFKQYAINYLGAEQVVDLPIRMTAEDFSYYSHEIPACFYRLGVRNEARGIISPLHTPTFNVDEDCLQLSTGLMAHCAISELESLNA